MTTNDAIADLLSRWEEAWEHGTDIPAAELCADRPELLEVVERKIVRLKRMSWMVRSSSGDSDGEEGMGDGSDPLLGSTLANRYRIEALIAEGGFGKVYKATDSELQRPVAVKVARGTKASGQAGLLDEARRVARLRHPGIVPVLDVGTENDRSFIVSSLIDGPNLAEVIEKHRPSPQNAARIVAEVADALHFAHGEGFIHRDIKPENVLLDNGHPLLTDFGLAANFEEIVRRKGLRSGTLAYMSPEAVAGESQLIGPRSDIYSLGVVFYELLTGHLPYQARTPGALREQVLFRPPTPPRSLNPEVPEHLEVVCLRCLSKLPADRYSTAADLGAALRATPPRQWRWLSFRWAFLVLLVVGLFATGLALGLMLPRQPKYDQSKSGTVTEDGVFVFDGTNRIVTPLERFAPCTLEAWVQPKFYPRQDCMFVIGSDIPTKHGIGLAMCESLLSAEYVAGPMIHSEGAIPLDRWSHVAAVFGYTETRLYLNGRRVGTGPATKADAGTTFVIGNVGSDNPINYWIGKVRAVCISKGERYTHDYVPEKKFSKDRDASVKAVLIYDGSSSVDGDRLIDLSGAENHGRWERSRP